jgi:hypothetical protein
MPTTIRQGNKVEDIELVDLFPASEGSLEQYYGKVGNGKTANGTYDIIEDLKQGRVVYANWKLNWEGFDQRDSFFYLFRSLIFPTAKRFYKFNKDNLRFIEIDENFIDTFEKITDAVVYLDEGHVAFDSYEMAKMSLKKRKAVLHTRHFNRTIKILSQRPTAIHVSLRANVNIFYKCKKLLNIPYYGILFSRIEFQELERENVDETKPEAVHLRLIPFRILNLYDSKYMRKGLPDSQKVYFEAYDLSYSDRLRLFISKSLVFLSRLKPRKKKIFSVSKKVTEKSVDKSKLPRKEYFTKLNVKSLGDNSESVTIKKLDQGGPNSSNSVEQKQLFSDDIPF